jgi:hypothetical protein
MQLAPGLQMLPHWLQFAGSLVVFVQTELQTFGICPGHPQTPPVHVAKTGHASPHPPQFESSV